MSQAKEDTLKSLGLAPQTSATDIKSLISRRPWLSGGIALVILAVLARLIFFGGNGAVEYVTDKVARGDLKVTVTATGTVEPVTTVTVGSEVSGRLEKVLVDYNDQVKQGQVLAELDTSSLQMTVEKSKANLEDARATVLQYEATLIETTAKWKRYRELSRQNAISKLDLDTSYADMKRGEANLASARAKVKSYEAQLSVDETSLSKAIIRSPIDGVVIERDVEPGQTVAATFETPTLFTLADDLRHMELQVKVDEADVGQVLVGQKATFTVDAYPNRRFEAEIEKVRYASTTTNNVVSYVAVLTVDNSELLLRPGMTATAEIVTAEKKDALLVPNGATRFTPPNEKAPEARVSEKGIVEKYVWVLKDGKPVAVPLQLGLTNGQKTEILAGDIAPDAVVITDVKTKGK
ncbi:efflux RND transporter periplasmic adaptor subunit [Parvibaculum sp.]|uniref:efflux RND transporter periplasmic adaptor subunit n=1 Tax=Parvibaculum sp. TaxID=2024848 RepID=UPI0032112398